MIVSIILLLVLAAIGVYWAYYRATKQLSFSLAGDTGDVISPPQFLYAFSGEGQGRLLSPIDVYVHGGQVYVTDSRTARVQVFNEDGVWQRSIGGTESVRPLYIARSPKDGVLFVSDRRTRSVHRYAPDGSYLGDFDPDLPESEMPEFETGGVTWVPMSLAFAPDGTLYVVDLLNGHRVLIFDPAGRFIRAFGTAAIVDDPAESPGSFQFPGGLMVFGDELYVADSNNRRIQVFDLEGTFKRFVVTQGLPRGLGALAPFPQDDASSTPRFVQADTLAHDITIWTTEGKKLLNFGEGGILEGQLNYPNGVFVGSKNKVFVADSSNARVQVWGWPEQAAALPGVGGPSRWVWLCLPLLLLPLLLLLRKRRIFATADFVARLIELGEGDRIVGARRTKWVTVAAELAVMKAAHGDADAVNVIEAVEHSPSDAHALVTRYDVSDDAGIILAVAQRTRLLCTEDESLRRVAAQMELDNVAASEFIQRSRARAPQAPGA